MASSKAERAGGRPRGRYVVMLLVAAVIWGGSYVVLKGALDQLSPGWLIGTRFLVTGAVLTIAFRRRLAQNLDGSHLLAGGLIGLFGGLGYLVQNMGLSDTTPSNNAFLTATYCVMVPFAAWAMRGGRPTGRNVLAALMCLAGIGFVSMGDSLVLALRWGDWMTLLGAVFFTLQIVLLSQLDSAHDTITITVVDAFAMGIVSLIYALVAEPLPHPAVSGEFVWEMFYVIALSSCVCTLLQNIGQQHVPPAEASLLLCLESVFGVIFSVVVYGDPVTPQLAVGFTLIFLAVVLSEVSPGDLARRLRSGGKAD